MAEEIANGVKTWVDRATSIGDAVNKIGLPLILLGLGIAAYFGWVPNPMGQLPQQLSDHDKRVEHVIEMRTQTDKNLVLVLEGLKTEISRINRVQRIRTCSEITVRSLRAMCLE